ncbi:MAG: undecaprenyldiphospho-muramoylpentapeptide beta-N-acetylglucosaminyltransferase [Oscillospiraceae bacterium]|nr:undecaprenyldiphospho-muramoylpentapeptide beta-N-acetylglucosaminyltransferase [Oscillospiraceae bacterium]
MRVLLSGGGTAGHINPALAIAEIIKEREPSAEFLYVGTPDGMEAKLVPKAGYTFASIKVTGFKRKLTPLNVVKNMRTLSYLASSSRKAKKLLKKFKPDIVIGTGGYVSAPIALMSAKSGIPTAIHEANAFPGITTKFLSKKVDIVMLSTEAAAKHLEGAKYTVTGLPVRSGIAKSQLSRAEGKQALGFDDELCILSFGGSLGSRCINEVIFEIMKNYGDMTVNHIHGYGSIGKDCFPAAMEAADMPLTTERRRVTEYINDMAVCLAAADLVICRAGASVIEELQALGRASILIPSPNVTENHQFHNAMVLGKAGAAVVIEEKDLTPEVLLKKINEFYIRREKLDVLAKRAASLYVSDTKERICNAVFQLTVNN